MTYEVKEDFSEEVTFHLRPKFKKETALEEQGIREIQIKATMRYLPMLVRMAIIKKTKDNKSWQGCGEIGTLYTVGGM